MAIEAKPVIERYLRPENYDRVQKDFKPVIRLINNSYGEYSLQLREDCFNIYYQGNSISKVEPNKNGTYTASIHSEFVKDLLEDLDKYSDIKHLANDRNSNGYLRFRIQPDNLQRFFQRKHWQIIWKQSLFGADAQKLYEELNPVRTGVCSMCGPYCALRLMKRALRGKPD